MRGVLCFLLSLLLTSATLAQSGSVPNARRLANQLGATQELPANVRLRFQLLAEKMDVFSRKKGDPGQLLSFFSDTRVMVWNRPVTPNVDQTMRQFESEMVSLARNRGVNLDLPPVGFAPRAGASLLSSERVTRDGLSNLILQTEQVATEILHRNQSSDLLTLRDGMTILREDLADGSISSDNVRNLLGARVRFLAGPASTSADQRLKQGLDQLGEVLRANFPPQMLRGTRGGQLTL